MSISKITAIFFLAYPAACLAADLPESDSDGWYSWRVAVVESAPELCCFSWNNGVATQKRCNLDSRKGGFSIDSENPFPSDEIQIYARMDSGSPAKIRVLSSQCPVTTDSAITDLGIADGDESVEWLQQYISPHTNVSDEAITTVAMHAGDKARDTLIDVAEGDKNQDNRENAIFWMAQVRIAETADDIKMILIDDKNADIREHAAFSYSQSTASDRAAVLIRQGNEDADPDVRSQAWFWLTQTEATESEVEIRKAIDNERDADVREDAVFALSQLPEDRAVKALASILENKQLDMEIREQALFWLAQAESDVAFKYVDKILSEN
jgi:HEAT repeat protein